MAGAVAMFFLMMIASIPWLRNTLNFLYLFIIVFLFIIFPMISTEDIEAFQAWYDSFQ